VVGCLVSLFDYRWSNSGGFVDSYNYCCGVFMIERSYTVTLSVPDQSVHVMAENKEDAEAQAYDWWCGNVVPCIEVNHD